MLSIGHYSIFNIIINLSYVTPFDSSNHIIGVYEGVNLLFVG